MKPILTQVHQTDTLPGEEVRFTVSKAHESLVMRSLADLYSNRELAAIREYSTNARDAMIEAGKADEPILVTLPSAMHPFFTVKDHGIGMDKSTLKELYTVFGDSTKRDSDDTNGILGFGCKSAVAYTNQFTVTAVKDGRKTVAVITRFEDSMGGYSISLKVVLEVDTNEPNGVSVEIPVHNWSEFQRKAMDFYRFWTPGTVLVDGKQPEWAVGDKIDDNLYYSVNTHNSYVVMGNVPYRIENPNALFPQGMNRINFVAYVPMGAVEFTPNREALKYSEHTKKNLHKIINDFVNKSVALAKNEIAAATTPAQAYTTWKRWRGLLGVGQVADLDFKGIKFQEEFEFHGYRYNRYGSRYDNYGIKTLGVDAANNALIVTGIPNVSAITSSQRRTARAWQDHFNRVTSYIYFTEFDDINSEWVSSDKVVAWEKIKQEAPKQVRPKATNVAPGRKAGTFDLITKDGHKDESDVPIVKDLYYVQVQVYNGMVDRGASLTHLLKQMNLDHEVVKVPANREAKFLREYPHAKPIMPYLESKVNFNGPSLLSDDAKMYLSSENEDKWLAQILDASKVDDPEMAKVIKVLNSNEHDLLAEYNKHYTLAVAIGKRSTFIEHYWTNYMAKRNHYILDEYPLAAAARRDKTLLPHTYFYINSAYSARKSGISI